MPLRWSVIIRAVVLLLVSSSAWAEAKVDAKVAKHFKVSWSSVQYSKTLNIQRASPEKQETTQRLSISCEIDILDPDLVLGTSHEGAATQLTDPNGRNSDILPTGSAGRGSIGMPYGGLRYHRRFAPPSQPSRWLSLVKSVLGLRQRGPVRPELVDELQPSQMQVTLDAGLCEKAGGEIRKLKGHFYALVAEKLEYIDVPFEPNSNWVRLTDDLEIQVREAQSTGSSYLFEIDTRPKGGGSMRPLSPQDPLSNRIFIERRLIGADGKPVRGFTGFRSFPGRAGGRIGGSVSNLEPIKKIRFVIAVNPAHYKIPFELEHIPLPKP
ncbi:MAG: hypothetical protein A2Z25_22745 [Planctomycetes bacterium RBG_16_55_9]|nr:MAG: hypothetical protein A2Z25_22745 [Planctomycetes bacterium RBG_16_55_9]